ncbi:MAG: carboxypeptidase-like regulatory domain-containing protein, partial [Bacteroidota bacterium]
MDENCRRIQKKTLTAALTLICFIAFGTKNSLAFQDQETESNFKQYKGEIVDASSKKPLVFATLSLEGTNISTITNTEGNFILKIPS